MTTYKGNSGVVKIGSNAIAEIVNFSITEVEGTVEDTALGDVARTHVPDELPDWSGSVNCHHFPGDTNGQAVALVGETLNFEFSPIGTASGREKLTGTGIVTSRQVGDVANAAIVPLVLQIKGTGALTHGTHSA
jgi:hypothetical protein